MKKYLISTLLFISGYLHAYSQAGEWTWISGTDSASVAGVYGIQGVPSVNNHPPGAYEYIQWKDRQGNFWIFGGGNPTFSDMWKYNPLTNEWTWVKGSALTYELPTYGVQGVPNIANTPGSRYNATPTWVDTTGNLWLFGSNYFQNDLWKYDIGTNEWTWMNGSDLPNALGVHGVQGVPGPMNVPGARMESSTAWTDAQNNLWMFGGNGYDDNGNVGNLNDLMKYDISTNEWTWMSGSSSISASGNYGIKGVSSPTNHPGCRWSHTNWKDLQGNLWLMGGRNNVSYSDVWKFDLGINEWTWMAGPNTPSDPGTYLDTCTYSLTSMPSSRFEHRSSVTDQNGRFWMFGGYISSPGNRYNDLWVFDPVQLKWNWVSGTNIPNHAGSYGTLGVSSPTNLPPARYGAVAWWGDDNRFYMFAGHRYPAPAFGDLWVYTPDTTCTGSLFSTPVSAFSAPNTICPGSCTDFTNLSVNGASYQWFFPGGVPSVSTDVNPANICYATPGNYDVQLIATNVNGSDTLVLANYITVYPYPSVQSITQSGDTLFALTGAASYQWYFNGSIVNGATNYYYVAQASGDYNVVAIDANGCEVEAAIFNVIASLDAITESEVFVYPNPASGTLTIGNKLSAIQSIAIVNMLGKYVMDMRVEKGGPGQIEEVDVSALSNGMYHLEVKSYNKIFRTKFIKMDGR